MNQEQFRKGNMTSWFLPVVLVLSLFAFSGVTSSSTAKQHKAATEQIDALRSTTKKSTSIKIFDTAKSALDCSNPGESLRQLASIHSRLVRIQVMRCAKRCIKLNAFVPLLPRSQSGSDEDFSNSQIG